MKVSEIMTKDVITVRPDTTVSEIARLLTTHRIHAVPVVDEEQRVIGIVSESDLFLKEKGMPFTAVKFPALFKQLVEPNRIVEVYEAARHHTAQDIMTREVVCADVNDDIGHVAWLMAQRGVVSVPVLKDGKLAGIVSRSDLIRLLARGEQ